jgi:hypothetical protein
MAKRILVIGELNVDLIFSGLPALPMLGQELLCDDFQMALGSSPAICASWLAALGASVDFWGKVGHDAYGEFVVSELERQGIGTYRIIHDPDIRTGVTVSLTYPHDRALFTYLGSIAALRLDDLDLILLPRYDHLHSASVFLQQGLRPRLSALYQAAKQAGLTTSLDSGCDPEGRWGRDIFDVLPHVDFFLPNEVEALHFTGASTVEVVTQAPWSSNWAVMVPWPDLANRCGQHLVSRSRWWIPPAPAMPSMPASFMPASSKAAPYPTHCASPMPVGPLPSPLSAGPPPRPALPRWTPLSRDDDDRLSYPSPVSAGDVRTGTRPASHRP